MVSRMREALRTDHRVDADRLVDRVEALRRFVRTVEGHLPSERLVKAQTAVERAGARLALSRDHTVVALAGSTGSGKSSLFNALAGLDLSPVGVLRPTTGVAHSCVWGPLEPAGRLLDWVGVLPRNRFVRESALDGDDEAALHGLVLLDLPDFDSVEKSHRLEVDRLLGLVDLVIWVLDPQKYADRVVHQSYLREFHRLAGVTVVVLNQADRLSAVDLTRLLADLRRLLERDELPDVPVLATSAVDPNGHGELRAMLERTVAARQAALERLNGDVDQAVAGLSDAVGPPAPREMVDRVTVRELTDALAGSAGVPAVVSATGRAYRQRAAAAAGWPLLRWLGRLRPDPLRRLHLQEGGEAGAPLPVTSVPDPDEAQRAAVGLAVRGVAAQAARDLPVPWPAAVTAAARSRLDDVPDALDRAVAGTDLGVHRTPVWWRVAGVIQWLATLAAVVGLGWLVAGYVVRALGLPALQNPKVGLTPVPTLLLLGGLLLGVLAALLVRPLVSWGARRAARRAEARLRAAVTEVARECVVAPVREVLHAYADARELLTAAGRS
ncbi:GTPase [Rhizomonospora bruguierae]|uniref:GTPase n=1 Tax=Rhizomonospora bruguierae TaxID=1581705 RepID=UPI001BCC299B|nr:GTPase [Micromonospora sp. NBRC 107566]